MGDRGMSFKKSSVIFANILRFWPDFGEENFKQIYQTVVVFFYLYS